MGHAIASSRAGPKASGRGRRDAGRASAGLGTRELDDLRPLLGFSRDELSKLAGRKRHGRAAEIDDPGGDLRIGETRVHALVDGLDDIGGRPLRRAEAGKRPGLEARDTNSATVGMSGKRRQPRRESRRQAAATGRPRCARSMTAGCRTSRAVSVRVGSCRQLIDRETPISLDLLGLCRVLSATQAVTCRQPSIDTPDDTPMPKPLTAIIIANLKPRPKRYEVSDGGCAG